MKKTMFILFCLFLINKSNAQLADGSIAPDFSLTDIDGNDQNLYSYLDAGKTVYLDIFAAHCPTCWAYHNTYALRDLYNNHGPSGTLSQDIMVIAIEHDPGNGINELTGVSGITAGDWVTGTPYPIINPEGTDRSDFITAYDAVFYPMIYAICPDRKITLIGTQNEATLYNHVSSCGILSIADNTHEEINVFYNNEELYVNGFNIEEQLTVNIYDISGKQVFSKIVSQKVISFSGVESGVYIYTIQGNLGINSVGKFIK